MEAGSAALRVDWPIYPRRAEHNTVAEGGNRKWAETARAGLPPKIGRKERPERHAAAGSGELADDPATKGLLGRRVRPARPPDRRRLMRKPNYRFERAERDRLKQAKKEEKAKRQQQERASDQKSEQAGQPAPSEVSDNG